MRRARAKGLPHKISYDADGFYLLHGADQQTRLFLHNAFKDWSEAKATDKDAMLDQIVAGLFDTATERKSDLESCLAQLLPVIRNRRDLETFWLDPSLNALREEWEGASHVLCDAISIILAVDQPASIALVNRKKLGEWDASFSSLLPRAVENLRENSPTLFERDPQGFYISQYNDQYDCSRLLLPELFGLLPLRGDPVAIAVARNGLVVAGSDDTSALLAMARFADQEIEKATRPICYLPLILKNGVWNVFKPNEPALAPLYELHAKQFLWDYECQRDLLQNYYMRIGRDVCVSKIEARKFGDRVYGLATWSPGLAAQLPRVDAVAIFRPDKGGQVSIRSWADFWTVCGHTLIDEGLYPQRFLTPPSLGAQEADRLERDFRSPDWLPPASSS
jgi:uncharacterized protein YtpQ (UPF0354 family)